MNFSGTYHRVEDIECRLAAAEDLRDIRGFDGECTTATQWQERLDNPDYITLVATGICDGIDRHRHVYGVLLSAKWTKILGELDEDIVSDPQIYTSPEVSNGEDIQQELREALLDLGVGVY